ncbi:MAG: hydantoinase/oxoprolinase family protein [Flavobacteriales bacterium]|nr:hydantoinase/oxoprolinase family protein [Flavobacteriales bacterium]
MARKIKVGIDVGGTFTHAIALDIDKFEIVGKACVPTTHNSKMGVAEGVVSSMHILLAECNIAPDEVVLIAHSTTQATNALLEGDVATVGIICLGEGMEGYIARMQTNMNDIELAPGKILPTHFKYMDISKGLSVEVVEKAIKELADKGAQVFVATEVFAPDHPENELLVVQTAEKMGYMATAASSLSKLYGIKVRTRTAIVNASMMPKMIETANMTEQSVRASGINAPLMVMRSDGGIMDVAEMRKRPILTMLSGPAAGVAAALMYAKISDGIFIEVGGTSTDISVIKNRQPQVKTAQIGQHRLSVKTIDVRTLGVGGGSVPRISGGHLVDVGPRSAHIANLAYSAFTDNSDFSSVTFDTVQPKKGDPSDYFRIRRHDGEYTVTPTAASYYLGLVKEVGHSSANMTSVTNAIDAVAKNMGTNGKELATGMLTNCAKKVEIAIERLIREYKLDRDFIAFVGGGGGASAIVPFTSRYMKIPHEIAKNAEVISAIGAALGMIRDTVEKSIVNPSEGDIIAIRQQAYDSVIGMGALPDTIEVHVEIDNANKKIIAIATGSSDHNSGGMKVQSTDEELIDVTKKAMKLSEASILARTKFLSAVGGKISSKGFLGMFKEETMPMVLIDREGGIKRKFKNGICIPTTVSSVRTEVTDIVERLRSYGDGGVIMPEIYIAVSGKILDMSGLIELSQILSVVDFDIKDFAGDEPAVVIAVPSK